MTQGPPPVHVIDDALPPAAIEAAYDALKVRQIPTSQVFVDTSDPVAALGDFVALPLALLLSRYLQRLDTEAKALGYAPASTFELWTNVTPKLGPTAFLHVDNDEVLREESGEVMPPEYGTILYLGPEGDFDGGGTLIGHESPPRRCAPKSCSASSRRSGSRRRWTETPRPSPRGGAARASSAAASPIA